MVVTIVPMMRHTENAALMSDDVLKPPKTRFSTTWMMAAISRMPIQMSALSLNLFQP